MDVTDAVRRAEVIAGKLERLTSCLATCLPLGEAGRVVVGPAVELIEQLRRITSPGTPEGVAFRQGVLDIFE